MKWAGKYVVDWYDNISYKLIFDMEVLDNKVEAWSQAGFTEIIDIIDVSYLVEAVSQLSFLKTSG